MKMAAVLNSFDWMRVRWGVFGFVGFVACAVFAWGSSLAQAGIYEANPLVPDPATVTFDTKIGGTDSNIAISGDGNTIVAGSPQSNVGNPGPWVGDVYVFTRKSGGGLGAFAQSVRLRLSKNRFFEGGDFFGRSVAVSGDGGVIAVGASELLGSGHGEVDVFVRPPGASWSTNGDNEVKPTATLVIKNPGGIDELGTSVAISENGRTVIAGAPGSKLTGDGSGGAGAVFMFKQGNGGWSDHNEADVTFAPEMPLGVGFGESVAMSDGSDVIAVGAPVGDPTSHDGTEFRGGQVLVFTKDSAEVWENGSVVRDPKATLVGENSRGLGRSVAISSDGRQIVAGATPSKKTKKSEGAVYAFEESEWNTGGLIENKPLSDENVPGNNQEGRHLGASVAISGDVILAGMPGLNRDADHGGGVAMYRRQNGKWDYSEEDSKNLVPAGIQVSDGVGSAVAVHGKMFVVGSPGDLGGGSLKLFGDDLTRPSVSIKSPVDGARFTRGMDALVNFACIDRQSGVAKCRIRVVKPDGTVLKIDANNSGTGAEKLEGKSGLPTDVPGVYQVSLKAKNRAGNVSDVLRIKYRVLRVFVPNRR